MGVQHIVKKSGNGPVPRAGEVVTVHFVGYVADGRRRFWSTRDDNKPFRFTVGAGEVLRGWDEGIVLVHQGEIAELGMTADMAYGARGFPALNIPANADLVFELELLTIGDR